MECCVEPYDDEVIDHDLLRGLAVLAKANERSVVEELNIAVSQHVFGELPSKIGQGGMQLLFESEVVQTASAAGQAAAASER